MINIKCLPQLVISSLLSVFSLAAQAIQVTHTFEGTFSDVGASPADSPVAIGDPFVATLSYDTDEAPYAVLPSGHPLYDNVDFEVVSGSTVFPSSIGIVVYDTPTFDGLGSEGFGSGAYFGVSGDNTLFDSSSLPVSLPLADLTHATVSIGYLYVDGFPSQATGDILSITTVVEITAECMGVPATIIGTEGHDYIQGTAGDDVILGLGGNDTIDAGDGEDIVCAGAGNDSVSGGADADNLLGGRGNDTLIGNGGADEINGGRGNDTLKGKGGDDTLNGNAGNDTCIGNGGADSSNNCESTETIEVVN